MEKFIKVLIIAVCAAMCAAFAACENVPETDTSTVSSAESELTTVSDIITYDESSTSDIELPPVSENPESEPESDAENVYSEVLANYKNVTDSMIDGTFDIYAAHDDLPYINDSLKYKWSNMINELSAAMSESRINLGYALYDIDKDGTNELFLINQDHDISAIFTVIDGKVQLLDAYWARYYATLCDDNTVFTHGTSGANAFEDVLYRLSEGEFVEILSLGCENGNYYKVVDGERSDITQEEYFSQSDSYESNNEVLEFIAI